MYLDSSILCILQPCLDYIRTRIFFPLPLLCFKPVKSLFTPVGEGCSLGIEAPGMASWFSRGASSIGRGETTLNLEFPSPDRYLLRHRDSLDPQNQDCGPDKWSMARHRSKQTPLFRLPGQLFPIPLLANLCEQVVLWVSSYYMNNNAFCWNDNMYLQPRLLITEGILATN